MTKHYCDICGRELNTSYVYYNDDPDDYIYGELTIDLPHITFTISDVCHGCAKKFRKITQDEIMEFIKEKMKEK